MSLTPINIPWKHLLLILSLGLLLLSLNSCNSDTSKNTVLKYCTTLGDESILYARANYVRLFNLINPEKFSTPYEKVKDFDHVMHRSTINTYEIAVRKLPKENKLTENLIQSCIDLAIFSKNFVDNEFPRALALKQDSKLNPLTDSFFLKINEIVKFDHTIGQHDKNFISFKQRVQTYENAVESFKQQFNVELMQ